MSPGRQPRTQRQTARNLLETHSIMRLSELRAHGVSAAAVSRMEAQGEVIRLSRGLYQLCGAPLDANHALAMAAKRTPKGVVCLVSALAFHGMTDQFSKKVWLAVGKNDWAPQSGGAPVRALRLSENRLNTDVETHIIEGVPVKVFSAARTVADCFRHRNKTGLPAAVEGLQEALRRRKAAPAELLRQAERAHAAGVIRPYLEALTFNG